MINTVMKWMNICKMFVPRKILIMIDNELWDVSLCLSSRMCRQSIDFRLSPSLSMFTIIVVNFVFLQSKIKQRRNLLVLFLQCNSNISLVEM